MDTNAIDGVIPARPPDMPRTRIVLAGLWTALMLTYLLADVLRILAGDLEPGKLGGEIETSQALYLVAAVVLLTPIVMIVLTLIVSQPWVRWATIIATVSLVLFNVAGLPYPGADDNLLTAVSFAFNALTVQYAWKWAACCPGTDRPRRANVLRWAIRPLTGARLPATVEAQATVMTHARRHRPSRRHGPRTRTLGREQGGSQVDGLAEIGVFFAGFFGGLGVFFAGIGVLWAVSVWRTRP